jgi:hypothetical protein
VRRRACCTVAQCAVTLCVKLWLVCEGVCSVVMLQALFRSIRARTGQCQLDHFELPCAADMSPLQVSIVVALRMFLLSAAVPDGSHAGGMLQCRGLLPWPVQ